MWPVIYGRAQMSTSRVLVYLAILVMYALSTVHTVATWLVVKSVFISSVPGALRFGNGPGSLGNLLGKVTEFALPVNTFPADCILVRFPTLIFKLQRNDSELRIDMALLGCVEPQDQDSIFTCNLCCRRSRHVPLPISGTFNCKLLLMIMFLQSSDSSSSGFKCIPL